MSAIDISSIIANEPPPALFTRMSSRPNRATVSVTEPITLSSMALSAWMAKAAPPAAAMSATT